MKKMKMNYTVPDSKVILLNMEEALLNPSITATGNTIIATGEEQDWGGY